MIWPSAAKYTHNTKAGGEGKRFLLKVAQLWGAGDSPAPLQFLPKNTDTSQPAPETTSVSRHPAPFLSDLLGPKAVMRAGLWLSSSRLSPWSVPLWGQRRHCLTMASSPSQDWVPDRCSWLYKRLHAQGPGIQGCS